MKYLYLAELDSEFWSEEGTEGKRFAALKGLEAMLKEAMTDLSNALKRPAGGPAPIAPKNDSRVATLIASHEMAQRKLRPSNIADLQAEVQSIRTWLQQQDCVVRADGSINWDLSRRKVEYDHDLAKQGLTKVRIIGGRLFFDDAGANPLDTSRMVSAFSGPGHAIFAMSATGSIHVSSHSTGHRHHSSLLAGQNVSAAGELKAANGHLSWLSNKSGHYKPSVVHLLQILHRLQKGHVPMTFPIMVLPVGRQFPTVGAFLKSLKLDDRPDYELMKLLAYSTHLDDAILCTHKPDPWRWRNSVDEVPAVYSTFTNQPVAHQTVREWLKAQGKFPQTSIQYGGARSGGYASR